MVDQSFVATDPVAMLLGHLHSAASIDRIDLACQLSIAESALHIIFPVVTRIGARSISDTYA